MAIVCMCCYRHRHVVHTISSVDCRRAERSHQNEGFFVPFEEKPNKFCYSITRPDHAAPDVVLPFFCLAVALLLYDRQYSPTSRKKKRRKTIRKQYQNGQKRKASK